MKRHTFFIEAEHKMLLEIISRATRGQPSVSALIREAIASFIEKCCQDEEVKKRMDQEGRPRLIPLKGDRNTPATK